MSHLFGGFYDSTLPPLPSILFSPLVCMYVCDAQIVIHGTTADTESLVSACNDNPTMNIERVFAPRVGDTVNVTLESHIYKARPSAPPPRK